MLRILIALKYSSSSAGFEPANLGFNCKHVTTRHITGPLERKEGKRERSRKELKKKKEN
jgi:hypothetical protein